MMSYKSYCGSQSLTFINLVASAVSTAAADVQRRERRRAVLWTALAFGAVRGVLGDRAVLRIFGIFTLALLANQMTRGYLPLLVEGLVPPGPGLASAIGLVSGLAALGGAAVSPLGGMIGDPFEVAMPTIPAAIANAIFDATGARLRQIPFVPDRVLAALKTAGTAMA